MSAFEAIRQRTLFARERKLPEVKPVEEKKPIPQTRPAPDPGFELAGVYLSAQENIALLTTRAQEKVQAVHLDETFKGWILYDLTADSAKLESNGQTITLSMVKKSTNEKQPNSPEGIEMPRL